MFTTVGSSYRMVLQDKLVMCISVQNLSFIVLNQAGTAENDIYDYLITYIWNGEIIKLLYITVTIRSNLKRGQFRNSM